MTQENEIDVGQGSATSSGDTYALNTPTSVSSEKLVPQSKVDEIVKTLKVDHHRQTEELKKSFNEQYSSSHKNNQNYSGGDQFVPRSELKKAIAETIGEYSQQLQQEENKKQAMDMVNRFGSKMLEGRDKYQDFDEVVRNVDYGAIGNTVQLLTNEVDNVSDVMYDIIKNNPLQLAQLETLAATQPRLARQQLKRLSESIKVNEKAKNFKRPNEPLRQLTPSNVGIDDGSEGNLSVADFRKMKPWKS
jgi:hypothetical protein